MKHSALSRRLPSLSLKVAVLALGILLWQAAAWAVGSELLLPSPGRVGSRLLTLAGTAVFWGSVWGTLLRIFLGFLSGCAAGVLLALLMHFLPPIRAFTQPFLTVIRATPVASFILLILLWLQDGSITVWIAFLMVLPIITENVRTGLSTADPKLLEAGRVFGISRRFLFRRCYLPAALPHFGSAARTSFGLAWKAGVAAEVLCAAYIPRSIGAMIYDSKVYLETADLFAWTAVVILCSLLIGILPACTGLVRRHASRHKEEKPDGRTSV